MTERLARACLDHPWRTIAAWLVALVLAVVAVATMFGSLTTDQRLTNNPESYRGQQLMFERLPRPNQVDEIVVVRSDRHTVDDPAFRAFVRELVERGRATGAVEGAQTYLEGDTSLVSRDRHATIVPLVMGPNPQVGIERVIEIVEDADGERGFDTAITGEWTIDRDFSTLALNDLKEGELFFGGPAALVILVLVFGALVAAAVPLILAMFAIMLALGAGAVLAQAFELSVYLQNMVTAVGLALGVDYSLFVLSRYREERARGLEQRGAIVAAAGTASRAVLFSGTAFVIAMVGLLLVPETIMRSLATGAIFAGIVAVLAALTLLPALLGLIGDRVNALRVPFVSRSITSGERQARFWTPVVRAVMRRPVLSLALASALLIAAAVPAFDLRTGFPSVNTFPDNFVSKEGLDALDRDFQGGRADPVLIVVDGDTASPEVRAAIDRLSERIRANDVFGQPSYTSDGENDIAVISVPYTGAATDPEPIVAVRELRAQDIPAAFEGVDARVFVAGETAQDVDYFDTMDHWLPIVFALVLGLSFVLLTIAFRSLVVAAKAIVLNVLSVGAAYGLMVLVFEKGVGNELLGLSQFESVAAWVPLFLFCILFGLSMDYHVFLLSRIRERFAATGDNAEAVEYGIRTTARLITGAALIIIVVFIGFASGDLVMFQQMGFGVAVALLIDATLVRTVLVPAAMQLLGDWNWYLPRWLEWLPNVHVEGESRAPQPRPPAAP